jgi:hypothetical protein
MTPQTEHSYRLSNMQHKRKTQQYLPFTPMSQPLMTSPTPAFTPLTQNVSLLNLQSTYLGASEAADSHLQQLTYLNPQ